MASIWSSYASLKNPGNGLRNIPPNVPVVQVQPSSKDLRQKQSSAKEAPCAA